MREAFAHYVAELKSRLEAKDLGQLAAGAPRGQIILIFPAACGDQPGRVSIVMKDGAVHVTEDTTPAHERHAVMRADFERWLDYCADPTPDKISKIEIYGDHTLFGTFGLLLQAKRSSVDVRLFPGHELKKKTKKKTTGRVR